MERRGRTEGSWVGERHIQSRIPDSSKDSRLGASPRRLGVAHGIPPEWQSDEQRRYRESDGDHREDGDQDRPKESLSGQH